MLGTVEATTRPSDHGGDHGVRDRAGGSEADRGAADVSYWNAVGGIGSLTAAVYLFSLDLPAALWWWPWMALAGGVLRVVAAALGAWIDSRY
jgi:hypothetical protein